MAEEVVQLCQSLHSKALLKLRSNALRKVSLREEYKRSRRLMDYLMLEMGASDADPKSVDLLSSFTLILEDTEGCNDRAIKRLKKQLKDTTMSTAVASWKITIYAGGLSPGVIEPQNLL
ncbi:hypothetical protein F5146DRAFT_1007050 [Armillaria mellea]|nr:hypothetical protein F5146DRAFT_1007050 [Armillaria mellea]